MGRHGLKREEAVEMKSVLGRKKAMASVPDMRTNVMKGWKCCRHLLAHQFSPTVLTCIVHESVEAAIFP
jgi:hypothetical protein